MEERVALSQQTTQQRLRHHRNPSAQSPARHIRNKSSALASNHTVTPPSTAKQSVVQESSTTIRPPSNQNSTRKSLDDEKRHFVGNVGSGGTLYLAPSRLQHLVTPATPPDTARSNDAVLRSSSAWTPRYRSVAHDNTVPLNGLTRQRSRSFSGVESGKDTMEVQTQPGSEQPLGGLLDMQIPHYRLGTPRFSAMGTAYLHNSICTDDDNRTSILSQQAYDGLFPVPPGKDVPDLKPQHEPHRLHPSSAARRRSRKPSPKRNAGPVNIFDTIEASPLDPATIRFSEQGQLVAASIPRLIAQITSPRFLDYELISDFFLTYRGFLNSLELLAWLIHRMRWALRSDTDAGRIVRVRTFVAMRHWILNYFNDDFVASIELRQQFCYEVNALSRELAAQAGNVVGDLNILGELKKCWRRTSALFWPVSDATKSSALEDITPGAPVGSSAFNTSTTSVNKTTRQHVVGDANQTLLTNPQLIAFDTRTNQKARIVSFQATGLVTSHTRNSSIPASPMSEDSLQVLSCSVPFLQKVKPDANAEKRAQKSAPRPVMQRQNSLTRQLDAQRRPASQQKREHRRTESDSVISRRTPVERKDADVAQVPSITLTGGLVRGLLLQPCPPMVQRYAPRSPPLDVNNINAEDYFDEGHGSVKRIVDDMRRALSHRKANSEASNYSNNLSSRSGSRASNHILRSDAPRSNPSSFDKSSISSTPRKDVLAGRVQKQYDQHFLQPDLRFEAPTPIDKLRPPSLGEFGARLGSQITNSSRSIVIVDATSLPAPATQHAGITEQITIMPLFPSIMEAQRMPSNESRPTDSLLLTRQRSISTSKTTPSVEGQLHESFIFPAPPRLTKEPTSDAVVSLQPRKSSSVKIVDIRPPAKGLRRVPGGDLRAADHIHDLETKEDVPSPGESLAATIISQSSSRGHKVTRSYSTKTTHTVGSATSQPHVRQSFRSEAHRLAKVRTNSDSAGGREAALAMLEGKPSQRRRHSGMSWLELPTNTETSEHVDQADPGADFEMVSPHAQTGQIYRVSKADHSEDRSLASPTSGHRASSLPVNFDSNAVYIVSDSDNDLSRRADEASVVFTNKHSFLLDDNQSLSDISTDIGEAMRDDDSGAVGSFFFEDDASSTTRAKAKPARSLAPSSHSSGSRPQEQPLRIAKNAARILGVPADTLLADVMQPPKVRQKNLDDQGHYPFVMAFESRVIAEQLCIIEKDALDEVDWKDLITLNWRQTPSTIRNWADYLKQEDSNGIDLVVARFNLVVKWVVSQCVLTESITERARCMTKFIHIAAHCLQLRNYASMAQIALALLSSDLARLQKTWALIHPADKHTLDRLEMLCQPLRNFANLRAEMESSPLADGCIPFIGLYTHDLMYNAQKPALLEFHGNQGQSTILINFERYQTAATVTKSLLRLLDASARYIFRPHPEALSRCLWLAALEDADIGEVSMDLE